MISKSSRLFITVLFFSLLLPGRAHAQSPQAPQGPPVYAPAHNPGEQPPDEVDRQMEKARLKKANDARQAQIKQDTDHLLLLATQLKEYVDKTNENILSLDVVKKADEIEKLAHNVKEKMKE